MVVGGKERASQQLRVNQFTLHKYREPPRITLHCIPEGPLCPPSATALGAQVPAALSPPQGLACARRARGAALRPGGAMDNQQQKRVFLDFLDQQGYMEEVHGMLGRQVGPVPGYG